MRRTTANAWLTLLCAALLAGCYRSETVYHVYRPVPTKGWMRTDTLTYEVAVPDSVADYHVWVEVRYRTDYPYRNLPLLLGCTDSVRNTLRTDTLLLQLTDAKGVWIGNGLGGLYEVSSKELTYRFDRKGTYRFSITRLLSTDDRLFGINDIGILVEKSEIQLKN
ncbi:MAG: gliding motility lipoprotein GldH [Mediterranea sp.]|jgi:gliding motility-associated lipoprotein GldH|nr:gliding motility lipoprotein GldH [Mediterranea sp.]